MTDPSVLSLACLLVQVTAFEKDKDPNGASDHFMVGRIINAMGNGMNMHL